MIHINIITAYSKNVLIHQLDQSRYKDKIYFAENSHEDIVWDYVVVFQNLNHDFDGMRYRQGGLIFIAGEPECMEPYCNRFFKQFDYVIIPHPHKTGVNIYHENPALNWHFGRSFNSQLFKYNYNQLMAMQVEKTANISMMCSNKTMMPGHVLRYQFYKKLKEELGKQIDFYGAGIKLIDDKADIIMPYRFHICVENSNDEHYWTEKIADSILGYAVPIYCGAPNITDYFPKEALVIVDVNKPCEAIQIIRKLLANPEQEYQKRLPALMKARELLLNKYNMFPMLERFIEEHHPVLGETREFHLLSYTEMLSWKIKMWAARFRRLWFKINHRK